jgi:hypothetical protein
MFIWSLLSFKYFYQRPVDRPTILYRVLGASPISASPYACMGPALYALGGRRVLPG